MKWTLAELRKQEFPIMIDTDIDFTPYSNRIDDLKKISLVHVNGMGYQMEDDEYVFSLDISADLVLKCAVSLEDVDYKLSFHTDEVFVKEASEDDLEVNIVANNTIDLLEVIVDNVALHVPMKVVKKGYENIYKSADEEETEEKINPAFESLKDFFK